MLKNIVKHTLYRMKLLYNLKILNMYFINTYLKNYNKYFNHLDKHFFSMVFDTNE